MTKAQRHMQRVRELGCLICGSPASAHHIREDRIKDDYLTIPLCPDHHQGDFSIHMAKSEFTIAFRVGKWVHVQIFLDK